MNKVRYLRRKCNLGSLSVICNALNDPVEAELARREGGTFEPASELLARIEAERSEADVRSIRHNPRRMRALKARTR